MKISFTKGNWEDKLVYAYTMRFPFIPKLIQENDCIRNGTNSEMKDGYDYTSLIAQDKYTYGTRISATCSFENYGAPLLIFVDKVWEDDGVLKYGSCYEIVVFEDGVNVWKHYMENDEVKWKKLFFAEFHVGDGEVSEISAAYLKDGFDITVNERKYFLRVDNLPSEVYVGLTACESINRFYDFTIESD